MNNHRQQQQQQRKGQNVIAFQRRRFPVLRPVVLIPLATAAAACVAMSHKSSQSMLSTTATSSPAASSPALPVPTALRPDRVTILAYGALLSESSSRLTFPDLTDFRHVRVRGLRRVFAHPHRFLVGEGLVDPDAAPPRIASLSAEPAEVVEGDGGGRRKSSGSGFVAAAFSVRLDDGQRVAFLRREAEYEIASWPYYEISSDGGGGRGREPSGRGVICLAGTDDGGSTGADDVRPDGPPAQRGTWTWPRDSGLLPADVYLRHCLLAVSAVGGEAEESFLEETYLADRKTTLAEYLGDNRDRVMSSRPPPHLATRFGG